MPEQSYVNTQGEPLPRAKPFYINRSASKAPKKKRETKRYCCKGVVHELKDFVLKDQMTLQDCKSQFTATFYSNEYRALIKASRSGSLPDEFGEGIVRLNYPEYVSFKSSSGKKGDMFNEKKEELAEIKTSTSDGPSSFSPTSNSETYFFCVVDMESSKYEVYRIDRETLGTAETNKRTNMAQLWEENEILKANKQPAARPRFSLGRFVRDKNMKPEFAGRLLGKSLLKQLKKKNKKHWEETEELLKGNA